MIPKVLRLIADRIGDGNGALIIILSTDMARALLFANVIGTLSHCVEELLSTFRSSLNQLTGNSTVQWSTQVVDVPLQKGSKLPEPSPNQCIIVIAEPATYDWAIPFYRGVRPFLRVDLDASQAFEMK